MGRLIRVRNPPNPYTSLTSECLEPPPPAQIEVFLEKAKSILSENNSPDLPFRWSLNPYRGCQHACAYCYARCTHEYLGLGAGTDFETKLVVKRNAPELLGDALASPRWQGESIHFSGATDCYQPLEAAWELTRRCLERCLEFHNPVAVVTKSFLIVRDAELLARLHHAAGVAVSISIPFADDASAKCLEPQAPTPARRYEAVRRLRDAGVPTGALVAPIIPALNDREVPEILQRCAASGAQWASYSALHLPGSVAEVFLSRLRSSLPDRARRIERRIRAMRRGELDERRFFHRFRGEGRYWQSIRDMFNLWRRRLGLAANSDGFVAPARRRRRQQRAATDGQMLLPWAG